MHVRNSSKYKLQVSQQGRSRSTDKAVIFFNPMTMAAAAAAATTTPVFLHTKTTRSLFSPRQTLTFPKYPSLSLKFPFPSPPKTLTLTPHATITASSAKTFHGPCYVLSHNIDTDQIIPAEHLTLVPSNPDEYVKLGSLALVGLPTSTYPIPFVEPGSIATRFPVIIAGANFGCGSSREHAPVALGAAGARVVVAESYARIFFRNSVSTGEVYPVESEGTGIWEECTTGDIVTVDLEGRKLVNHSTGKEYGLKPIGDAGPVIEAGGIFAYARKTGMIASATKE